MDEIEETGAFFLQKLRKLTKPMHVKLEESKLSVNLMKPNVSLDEYIDYLEHMKAVISFHENFTFPKIEDMFPDIKSRQKLSLINRDLECLKKDKNKSQMIAYEISTDHPLDVPRALGYLYVVEGSTLGGQMLLKHINTVFGYDDQKGACFFAGYGKETGKRWQAFLNIFTDYAVAEKCQDQIIAGAIDAFESIQLYFA